MSTVRGTKVGCGWIAQEAPLNLTKVPLFVLKTANATDGTSTNLLVPPSRIERFALSANNYSMEDIFFYFRTSDLH